MVIFDANVVLDFILARRKVTIPINSNEILSITPTTLHIIYYFAEKYKIPFEEVKIHLNTFQVLDFNQKTYNLAVEIGDGKDFEDTLQIATAIHNEVDKFVTGDQNLAQKYSNLLKFVVV